MSMSSSSLFLRATKKPRQQLPEKLSAAIINFGIRHFSSTLPCGENPIEKSPSFIHPSAIVHPNAILGQGVSIGPFCSVGSSVKLGNACQLYPGSHVFGDTEVGDNCTLMTGAIIGDEVPGSTIIGCNNVIGHHAVVGIKCQDLKYEVIILALDDDKVLC